jgi:hypothetical protein
MKYDHKFTYQILLLHRNKGHNGLHFGHFEGRKTHCRKRFLATRPHIIGRRRENRREEAGKECITSMALTVDGMPIMIFRILNRAADFECFSKVSIGILGYKREEGK